MITKPIWIIKGKTIRLKLLRALVRLGFAGSGCVDALVLVRRLRRRSYRSARAPGTRATSTTTKRRRSGFPRRRNVPKSSRIFKAMDGRRRSLTCEPRETKDDFCTICTFHFEAFHTRFDCKICVFPSSSSSPASPEKGTRARVASFAGDYLLLLLPEEQRRLPGSSPVSRPQRNFKKRMNTHDAQGLRRPSLLLLLITRT